MKRGVSLENSAMAVVFYKGRVLATMEDIYGNTALSLPKGHIEAGETAIEAAIRECFEETNVIVTGGDVVCQLESFEISFTTPNGRDVIKTITPILFNILYKCNPRPLEKRVKAVGYMNVDEFLSNCSYDNVKKVVQSALKLLNYET